MDFETAARIWRRYEDAPLNKAIAEDDQMWLSGPDWYWSVGKSGLSCVLSALTASWTGVPKRIMDLPCGHGRVGRHLRAAWPEATIYGCDLDERGVAFCSAELGFLPVPSAPELSDVELPKDLDLIWIGSLFTHVDRERTERWLSHLVEALAPHGVIVATFHGLFSEHLQATAPMINPASWQIVKQGFDERGYGYAPYTEHDMGDYGVSLSRPSTLTSIAEAIPGTRIMSYVERGWANNHDVLALTKNDRLATF